MTKDDIRAQIHDKVSGLLFDVVVESPKGEGLAAFMRNRARPAIMEIVELIEKAKHPGGVAK